MISVIGIGPSSEDMTIRALNAIKAADVIITYKSYIKNIRRPCYWERGYIKGNG